MKMIVKGDGVFQGNPQIVLEYWQVKTGFSAELIWNRKADVGRRFE